MFSAYSRICLQLFCFCSDMIFCSSKLSPQNFSWYMERLLRTMKINNVRKQIGKVFSEGLVLDMIYMKRKYIGVSFYFAKYPGLKNMQMMDLIFLSWAQIKASLCTQKKKKMTSLCGCSLQRTSSRSFAGLKLFNHTTWLE